ncbi:MAG: hypothetical protein ABR577_00320 [Pyrinomonadaceae bacterium]
MQTIEFLETAKWIVSQFTPATQQMIFTEHIFPFMMHAKGDDDIRTNLLIASHETAVVRIKLESHSLASEVLRAFKLEKLLDETFPLFIANKATGVSEQQMAEAAEYMRSIVHGWKLLTDCIKPLEELMIPSEVAKEQDFDELLTIELRYERKVHPQARTISEILTNVTKLYEAVATASGNKEFDPLLVIYANSGSSFRFDFKGLGEPIKQVKGIFIDAWNNIRHRKADDFHHNGKAIIEGLDILKKIQSHRQHNILSPEDANRLSQQINKSMFDLFESGALLREVPDTENVSNKEIMSGIQQKLLPPAPADTKKENNGKKKPQRAKTKTKKSTKSSSDNNH